MTDLPFSMTGSRVWQALRRAQLDVRALLLRALPPRTSNPLTALPSPVLRRVAVSVVAAVSVIALACGGLWWRLASGPLSLDVATPWLISALENRLGGLYKLEVGGTQFERDEDGRTALRLRDVVLRGTDGIVVASAPKADVGIAGASILTGNLRAERLSLIGAEMAMRIERDGRVNVFAAASESAPAQAPAHVGSVYRTADATSAAAAASPTTEAVAGPNLLATALAWLRSLDAVGFDGHDLMEIGLKNGNIALDDRRSGKHLSFGQINLSLTRLKEGGAALAVSSMGTDGPWSLNATVMPRPEGNRAIEAVVRDISPKDILLALRLDGGSFQADVPLSAVIRAEVTPDGRPQWLQGRIIGGAGYIGDAAERSSRFLIDEAQIELRWDAANRVLMAPVEIQAGASRLTLMAQIEPPREQGGIWSFSVTQGTVLLASIARPQDIPLVLDRVSLRGTVDTANKRVKLEQADLRGMSGGVALSGTVDYSGKEPRLMLGVAGTRMGAAAFKRMWPAVVSPQVRAWVEENLIAGSVERVVIATNTPLAYLHSSGPAAADDAVSVEIVSKGTTIRPIEGLPPVKDADLVTRVSGRKVVVNFARGQIDLPSGRKLTVAEGSFEVPDTGAEPVVSRTKFRIDGTVEAAAELLAMDPLREGAALPFEANGTRGNVAAQVSLAVPLKKDLPKGSVAYAVEADVTGFSAERFIRGQKAEAAVLRVTANQNLVQFKGDMKIGGSAAAVEYRKARAENEGELRVHTTLDETTRSKLGLDFANALSGPVPVKVSGRIRMPERDSRLSIEADLTQAKVTELLPGWSKAAGKPARASFVLTEKNQLMRLDDFTLEGSGAAVKGIVELDSQGAIQQANFPSYSVADGDKASLKAERSPDGTLKVALRGDLFDGRGLVRNTVAGQKPERARPPSQDLDLDIKLGAITGHHGEALRSFELRLSRRNGHIRSFALSGKLGAEGHLTGDMRGRGNARQVLYVESTDAGALFRFTDIYPRIIGGVASIAMDPPTLDNAPQDGLLNIRDFAVRGEAALERVASNVPANDSNEYAPRRSAQTNGSGVPFSRMRVEFTRLPGRVALREGIVWGPSIGATVDGTVDYTRDDIHLRGTFVPAYGLNNMFSRVPLVGMFLGGGQNEGLLGITYQVVGSPRAPMLQVNPMSAVAPGFLRKLFEFRGAEDRTGQLPETTR